MEIKVAVVATILEMPRIDSRREQIAVVADDDDGDGGGGEREDSWKPWTAKRDVDVVATRRSRR